MFQPNVGHWQQQQQQPHPHPHQSQHQQQPHPHHTQHQQQPHQYQQQTQNESANLPHIDGKWRELGLNGPAVENNPSLAYNFNQAGNQAHFNNYPNFQRTALSTSQPTPQVTQQQPQQYANNVGYFEEVAQQPQPDQQGLTQNFFDNNQNNAGKSDGWEDWEEWNENSINAENNNQQQQQTNFNLLPPPQQQQQQNLQGSTNVINESFTASDANWNWNMSLNGEQQQAISPISTTTPSSAVLPPPPTMQAQQQQVQRNITDFQQPPAQLLDRANENILQTTPLETNNEHLNLTSKVNANNNIPNTVFVTQAKPVTMPSRQFASTPNEILAASTPLATELVFAPPPEGFQNDTPIPIMQTKVSALPTAVTAAVAPPPVASSTGAVGGNPFKRTGSTQHHVANFLPTAPKSVVHANTTFAVTNTDNSNNNFFQPPSAAAPFIYEQADNSEVLHENQEVVTQMHAETILVPPSVQQQPQHLNDERNQYLQTSHLSENAVDDNNHDADNLPPPGLSRLVLGQPELVGNQRLVTGTEDALPDLMGNMSLNERHADGEDNAEVTAGTVIGLSASIGSNMQITADRNLYLVPGQSNGNNDQLPRVLTGFDLPTPTHSTPQQPQPHVNISEQREIELDGENIEDQQQQQQTLPQYQRNEPPAEGAVAQVEQPQAQQKLPASLLIEAKDPPQAIVNKEESDLEQHKKHLSTSRKHLEQDHQSAHEKKRSSIDHFNSDVGSEEAAYSSDRERERDRERQHKRRNYREGSVRSELERDRDRDHDRDWDRERNNDDQYQKESRRRERRDRDSGDKERPRDKYRSGDLGVERHSKRYTRYEYDSSHEESSRKEKSQNNSRRSIRDNREGERDRDRERDRRSDREYDDMDRRYRNSKRGMEREAEQRPRRDRERDRDYDDITDRRRRRDKHAPNRTVNSEREEYEEYRKQSSRNARESDIEKDRASRPYDPRYAAMYGYHTGQTSGTYGAYDPYYYYEHMARYNPQAYNEMIKKYYGSQGGPSAADVSVVGGTSSNTATATGSDHLTGDGRESVHSGRSSLQQDHER